MALLTGMTEDGREVPVQVDSNGRLVAEGLQGAAGATGPAGQKGEVGPVGPTGPMGPTGPSDWARLGNELRPKNDGDSVVTTGAVKVGGVTGPPNVTLSPDGRVGITEAPSSACINLGRGVDVNPTDVSKIHLYYDGDPYTYGFGVSAQQLNYKVATDNDSHVFYGKSQEWARIADGGSLYLQNGLFCEGGLVVNGAEAITCAALATASYPDNAAAKAAGLVAGDFYRKADGTVMVAY